MHDDIEAISASSRFRKMEKDLYHGNGKPGICTRLELLEDAVSRTEEALEKFQKGQDRITWLIVSGVILAVLNMVVHR